MDLLKKRFIVLSGGAILSSLLLSGCQVGYLLSSAKGQLSLLNQRVPIEDSLKDEKISEEEKSKIKMTIEARKFAKEFLNLNSDKNYLHYVSLDRPYVVYAVNASPKWELTHHTWWFPIIGSVPYKGFFNEEAARNEELELKAQNLDTNFRGVSTYSTLGWFSDPLLSSMLKYREQDLVNTIIHESVHATLYIKSSADFNERLAVFVGTIGTLQFYKMKEGDSSPTVALIQKELEDEKTFSDFISAEIKSLEEWYKNQKTKDESIRQNRIQEIQVRFKELIAPKMKTDIYKKFPEMTLNNAKILLYKTYVADLSDFQKLYIKNHSDIKKFLEECKTLESSQHPEEGLKRLINEVPH